MAFDLFPHGPSFPPYVFPPVPFLPALLPQPSQSHLDYDDDGEPLSPVPSADDQQDPAPGSSKSGKSGRKKTNPKYARPTTPACLF